MVSKRFLHILFICAFCNLGVAQNEELERLIKGKDMMTSIRIIDSVGYIARQKDPTAALFYADKMIEVSRRFKNDTMVGKALWRKARYYRKQGDFERAEKLLDEADTIFKRYDLPSWQVSILTDRGNINLYKGLTEAALTAYLKAIALAEKAHTTDQLGALYANLGNIYLSKNYDKSIEYYSKAFKYLELKNDTVAAALTLDNLGLVYNKKKDYKTALTYHFKALKLIERLSDKTYLAESYVNIGIAYTALHDPNTALSYYKKAQEIYKTYDSKFGVANVNVNIGEVYFLQNKTNEAIEYYLKGFDAAKEINSFELLSTYADNLTKCYEKINKPVLALKYYKEYMKTRDTIINLESSQQINELTEKYESKQKQVEIDLLTKDNLINETKIKQNKYVNTALILGILLTFIMLSAFYFRYRDKKKAHLLLEEKNKVIEEKQKEIFDSLQYARQIQKLLLANHKLVNETLPDSFVMFKPKDIVSGDFYWAAKKEDDLYLAVCDSTGHGVPGAFMSLLNINFLNEAVNEKNISQPNEVFNYVRKRLVDNLSQDGRQDGMDGILICVNAKSKKMTYAASNNAPVIIKNNTLTILGADKMPIGKGEKNEPFKHHEFEMNKGDLLYLSTDGFADQFGGPKGKKYKYKPMYDLLLKNSNLSVMQQEELLFAEFENWKGSLEQVDDVCILGIRF